jgi:hypothetical protein
VRELVKRVKLNGYLSFVAFSLWVFGTVCGCAAPVSREPSTALPSQIEVQKSREPSIAGSWHIEVQKMNGQRGLLRIGTSGSTIGFLFDPQDRIVQPVRGVIEKDGNLRFGLYIDSPKFHDPVFVETGRANSRLLGTWLSGAASPEGGSFGNGSGTWSAQRYSTLREPKWNASRQGPRADHPPAVFCDITDPKGNAEVFEARGDQVRAGYLPGVGALSAGAFDGQTWISLAFPGGISLQPATLDVTASNPITSAPDISWRSVEDITVTYLQSVPASEVKHALAAAGVASTAIDSFNRSPDGRTFKFALSGVNMRVSGFLYATGPYTYVSTRRAADALTYQAATGLSPGWYTLRSENIEGSTHLRFFGTEDVTIAGAITAVPQAHSYDFVPTLVRHLRCSIAVDVDPNPPILTHAQQLENAAKALH